MPVSKKPSTYDVMRTHGVDRRTFLSFCTKTAAALGLSATAVPDIVKALTTEPRIPVIWLHGLECTCCSESLLPSSQPLVQDVIMNMISLDYDDTLQVAAGFQAEEIRENIMAQNRGGYVLAEFSDNTGCI
jgi:hydrogenase small subunit